MLKKLIIGNFKMNIISPEERERYVKDFKKIFKGRRLKNSEVVLCPPFVHLESLAKNFKAKSIKIGAQNMFWEKQGSFTGEISPAMIKNLKCDYVIIGHSERRRYFQEKEEEINEKVKSALAAKLQPILCLGENKEEREKDLMQEVVTGQLEGCLKNVSRHSLAQIVIAYEPIWAVGSDVLPTSDEILTAKLLIKKILINLYDPDVIEKIRIVYGGSVKPELIKDTCLKPKMDGVLVGRDSLVPRKLIKMTEIIESEI